MFDAKDLILGWAMIRLRNNLIYPVLLIRAALARRGQDERERGLRSYFLYPQIRRIRSMGVTLIKFGAVALLPFVVMAVLESGRIGSSTCLAGCLGFFAAIGALMGSISLAAGGVVVTGSAIVQGRLGKAPTTAEVVGLLRHRLVELKRESLNHLSLVPSQLEDFEDYLVVTPVIDPVNAVDYGDVLFREEDGSFLFSVYKVVVVQFARHFMGIYECHLNLIKNITVNDVTVEYGYGDIASFETREESSSAENLPTGVKVTSSQHFLIALSNSQKFEIGALMREFRSTGKVEQVPGTDTERAISAIRDRLREKKEGVMQVRDAESPAFSGGAFPESDVFNG